MPLTRFLSLPFVRAADPAAYKALLEEAAEKHGPATAALFAEVSASGLLYDDPDVAGVVRHIVYDLEFKPLFEPEMPRAFLDRLRPIPGMQKDWLAAQSLIKAGQPDKALPLLTRVLDANPNHAQALLAASGILASRDRAEMAKLLYAAARTETGLGHRALLAVACGLMGESCSRLKLPEPAYGEAVRGAMSENLFRSKRVIRGLKAADRDLVFHYGRAMAANGRFAESERACTAALELLGRSGGPRSLRASILLERAGARLHIRDPYGAYLDLEDIRPLITPAWEGHPRWQALRDSTQR
jgi:tetratricopeptide (TPR) repeat protein